MRKRFNKKRFNQLVILECINQITPEQLTELEELQDMRDWEFIKHDPFSEIRRLRAVNRAEQRLNNCLMAMLEVYTKQKEQDHETI